MATYHKLLEGSRLKIERAKKHIQDLNVALKAFGDSNPHEFNAKRDPKTNQLVYYLVKVSVPPPVIAAIAGDIIQNLRTALDYLAYQLVIVGTGKPGPFEYVYFPIFDSADKYEAGKVRQVKGMRPEAVEAIDVVEPYKGGNDPLWQLHQLNRIDKHRLLLTAASYYDSFDIGGYIFREMQEAWPDMSDVPILSVFLKPEDSMRPLKVGVELLRTPPDAKVDKEMKFATGIFLNEPKVIETEHIFLTLKRFIEITENVIQSFDSPVFWVP